MKKTLLIATVLFSLGHAAAQQNPLNAPAIGIATELSSAISGGKSQFVRTFDQRFDEATRGTPFLADEWLPGTLTLLDSSRTDSSLEFKFDTYFNEIWVLKDKKDSVILQPAYIRALEIRRPGGKGWTFKKYLVEPAAQQIKFYQPVYEGRQYTLAKDEYKVFAKANFVERGVYTTGLPYDRFEGVATDYYLQTAAGKPFVKVSLKKKDFADQLSPTKAKALETFCKKEKIGKSFSEEEAARVLEYLEQ